MSPHPLRRIRTVLAVLSIAALTLLFLDYTGTFHHWFAWLAKVQAVPAVLALNFVVVAALVAVTLIFGRIYCSVICPLGILQDVFARLGHRKKKLPYKFSTAHSRLRLAVLGVFIVALVLGVGSVAALLEPYGAFGRIAQNLLQPLYEWGGALAGYVAERTGSYAVYGTEVWVRSLPTFIVAALTLVLVGTLAWRGGRTYCNAVCPVGTMLGFLSRFSLLKVRIVEGKCISCGICARHCKASCIDSKHHKVDYSRCVACGNCLQRCSHGALKYGMALKGEQRGGKEELEGIKGSNVVANETAANGNGTITPPNSPITPLNSPSKGRRAFLAATATVTATAAMAQTGMKVDGGLAAIEDAKVPRRRQPLTPPGSLSAQNMARRCTGCQLCVSECPNNVLRPSGGLMTLMQPEMGYERGWCRPECNRCSKVCPAGAIQPVGHGEKVSIQIGRAVWVRQNCIVTAGGADGPSVRCGHCAEVCPNGAIAMVADKENPDRLIPTVNAARCIGCGACEHLCPARPFTGIYVEGLEQHREV
ncbi:MAG: 4Fe-4S binding protein [Bacteroidaceae bacterium]|nr:4Fe-4S binding protein [Bacteroidaceae bacterium]